MDMYVLLPHQAAASIVWWGIHLVGHTYVPHGCGPIIAPVILVGAGSVITRALGLHLLYQESICILPRITSTGGMTFPGADAVVRFSGLGV
jgi:hypothetical protein